MRESKTPRVVAAAFLGLLFGTYQHLKQVRWLNAGRDAFLADQSRYFDKITQTHIRSGTGSIMEQIIPAKSLIFLGISPRMSTKARRM